MKADIFNSQGIHVAVAIGRAIFDLTGKKLYDLKELKSTGYLVNWLVI
jgi:hypothetical protein